VREEGESEYIAIKVSYLHLNGDASFSEDHCKYSATSR
jgi:hypothetical protein